MAMTEDQLLFAERCWRYIQMVRLDAPKQLMHRTSGLIEESVQLLSGAEIAQVVRDFSQTVAVFQKIQREVDAQPIDYSEEPDEEGE